MPSKLVTDREKSSRAVASAADTHAAEIAAGIARELGPHLASGEQMPDVALLVRLVGRRIRADSATLVAADEAHERELADDAEPRDARDRHATTVRAALVDTRAAIEITYGAPGLRRLGLDGAVPVDPSVIATQADQVVRALRDGALQLPAPRRAGMQVDRASLADDIAASLPALQEALRSVAREDQEKNLTLRGKQAAMARNDGSFTSGATWLSASCTLAGLAELAGKVRPSGRKPGRTAAEDEAEEPSTGA